MLISTTKRIPFEIRPTIIRFGARKKCGQDYSDLGKEISEITGAEGLPDYIVYLFRGVDTWIVSGTRWHSSLFNPFIGKETRVTCLTRIKG